jgi:hypothetical protein
MAEMLALPSTSSASEISQPAILGDKRGFAVGAFEGILSVGVLSSCVIAFALFLVLEPCFFEVQSTLI